MTENNKTLEEIAREERNAYFREWRSKNKDKVKATNKRYWRNRVEKKLSEEKGEHNDR